MALYTAPDQVVPVVSCLAAAVGIILVFWNKLAGVFRRMTGRPAQDSGATRAAPLPPARNREPEK